MVGLIDKDCNTVVEYTYDSWVKLLGTTGSLADTLGTDQPFRYRGYVYDTETGWYYLQSRYYDPTTCRFISADVYLSTGQGVLGHNAYAYCLNNPANSRDDSGCISVRAILDFLRELLEGGGGGGGTHGRGGGSSPGAGSSPSGGSSHGGGISQGGKGSGNSTTGTKHAPKCSPNTIGKLGEQLAGIDPSAKVSININDRVRIPDKMTPQVLTEVKNVKYISNTSQLRDFADYAKLTNRSLELYVRPTTVIAKTVINAGWEIEYLW